jgi:D-alanine-D-alanine ligase
VKIGLTYDLRDEYRRLGYGEEETAEFDSVETIQAIENALASLGHNTDRIGHIAALTTRLAAGERWDLVFNIAEGLNRLSREAQVPALLDAFRIPYTFSDPVALALTLHKGMAKHVVRDLGIPTPDFAVAHDHSDLEGIRLPLPLFVKPVAGGSSMGISPAAKICEQGRLLPACRALWTRFRQPVLVESFLEGREFTVGVVGAGSGAKALGVMEILLQPEAEPGVYSYANKRDYQTRVCYRLAERSLAEQAMVLALKVWKGLGCRDAGRVDLRCDSRGELNFLEVNPLAGLHPENSDLVILCRLLGISYQQLIRIIMESVEERLRPDLVFGPLPDGRGSVGLVDGTKVTEPRA